MTHAGLALCGAALDGSAGPWRHVYALCHEAFAWAEAEVRSVARTSISASFANENVKAGLREALSRWQRGPTGASA